MGRACARRSSALRISDFGRRPSRAELEHHFEETRELSKGLRWISSGKDWSLRQARCAAVAAERRHRAEPIENRSRNHERENFHRRAKRIRNFRHLSLERSEERR